MNILANIKTNSASPAHSAGVALFEILIALLVLSVGLLGLATLQSQGLRSSSSATMRTEATFLAMDIIDSMRASMTLPPGLPPPPPAPQPVPAIAAGYLVNTNVLPAGCPLAAVPPPAPAPGPSTPAQDICIWANAIQAQLGGRQAGSWQASILAAPAPAPAGALIVTIMWDDARTGARGTNCSGNAAADMACFQTLVQP